MFSRIKATHPPHSHRHEPPRKLILAAVFTALLLPAAASYPQGCIADPPDDPFGDLQCPGEEVCIDGHCERQGLRNPLEHSAGGPPRSVARRDDELFFITGRFSDRLGMLFSPTEVRRVRRRSEGSIVALANGRVLGTSTEQAATVLELRDPVASTHRLEVLDLFDLDATGTIRFGASVVAAHAFTPANPLSEIGVAVGDVDNIREPFPSHEFHQEVVLAYEVEDAGVRRVMLTVLGFEDVEPPAGEEPLPPTSETSILLTTELKNDGTPNRIRVGIGDLNEDGPGIQRDIAVAMWDPTAGGSGAVVIEAFQVELDDDDNRSIVPLMVPNQDDPVPRLVTLHDDNEIFGFSVGAFDGNPAGGLAQVVVAGLDSGNRLRLTAWGVERALNLWQAGVEGEADVTFNELEMHNDVTPVNPLPESRIVLSKARLGHEFGSDFGEESVAVLVDTNFGPLLTAVGFNGSLSGPDTGALYGDQNRPMVWPTPNDLDARSSTTSNTLANGLVGNFVDLRSRLVPAGGNENRASAIISYPDDPDGSQMIRLPFSREGDGGPNYPELQEIGLITAPLLLMAAVDIDGDNALYETEDDEGNQLFLGEPTLFEATGIQTANTVLHEPPKHVDYLRDLGGMVNISQSDDFFAAFASTVQQEEGLTEETKSGFTMASTAGYSLEPQIAVGIPFIDVKVKATQAEEITQTHESSTGFFKKATTVVTLTQVAQTERDDQLVVKEQRVDLWRYPVLGVVGVDEHENPIPDEEQPVNPLFDLAIPSAGFNTIGPGRLVDDYHPFHQNGNILTYPSFSLDTFEPLDIGPFQLLDAAGQAVGEQPLPGTPIWADNAFIVGGSSVVASLTVSTTEEDQVTVASSDTYKQSLDLSVGGEISSSKGPFKGTSDAASCKYTAENTDTFTGIAVASNQTSVTTQISIEVPSAIPGERGYKFHPAWYFTEGGGVKVTHASNTTEAGAAARIFWETTYALPDAALNMPHRIVAAGDEWVLGTDFSRKRAKGFFVLDAEGDLLFRVPEDGDTLSIRLRVFNLSTLSRIDDLEVELYAQEILLGQEVGDPILIGEATVACLPAHGKPEQCPDHVAEPGAAENMGQVEVPWDTTGFGPPTEDELRDWLVYARLDPRDLIPNETHEWKDRFDDPLVDGNGDPLDDLEKGQNNEGWTPVSIAAAAPPEALPGRGAGETAFDLCESILFAESATGPGGPRWSDVRMRSGALTALDLQTGRHANGSLQATAGTPLELSVSLEADVTDRRIGLLNVFAEDPHGGLQRIVGRQIWGVDAGSGRDESFRWTPREPGTWWIFAEYGESAFDRSPGNALDSLRIEVLPRAERAESSVGGDRVRR